MRRILAVLAAGAIVSGCNCSGDKKVAPLDSGVPDSGIPDSGTPDAGQPDSGTPDSGSPDSGTFDAGPQTFLEAFLDLSNLDPELPTATIDTSGGGFARSSPQYAMETGAGDGSEGAFNYDAGPAATKV